MSPEAFSDVRVVVLTHGSGLPSVGLVEQLVAEGIPGDRIVVVHNPTQPQDPSPEMPDATVEVRRTPRNLGYTGGMNLGLAEQMPRDPAWILLLTHDVRFRPGALQQLVQAARRADGYGVLGPELYDPRRGVVFSYGAVFHWIGGSRHRLELPPAQDGIAPCDVIDGAFMLMRTAALRQVGTFDERLFIYAEEADLCLRIRRAGYEVGVVLGARGEQEVGQPARPGAFAYLMTRNGLNFARNAAGAVGLAGALGRVARDLVMYGRRVLDPRRPEPLKLAARAAVVGTLRGAGDYFRGRWGPPPDDLPGLGDTRGT